MVTETFGDYEWRTDDGQAKLYLGGIYVGFVYLDIATNGIFLHQDGNLKSGYRLLTIDLSGTVESRKQQILEAAIFYYGGNHE